MATRTWQMKGLAAIPVLFAAVAACSSGPERAPVAEEPVASAGEALLRPPNNRCGPKPSGNQICECQCDYCWDCCHKVGNVMKCGGTYCSWDCTDPPPPPPPVYPAVAAIAAGTDTSYALKPNGDVYGWGADQTYALMGNGNQNQPLKLALPLPATQIAAAPRGACALLNNGTVACWGEVSQNDGTTYATATLIKNPSGVALTGVLGIAAGGTALSSFACAWTSSHAVYCWGDNDVGQLGNGGFDPSNGVAQQVYLGNPTQGNIAPVSDAVQVVIGGKSACYLSTSGTVSCWGDNGAGEWGLPATTPDDPNNVPYWPHPNRLTAVAALSAGGQGTFCSNSTATPPVTLCWGVNAYGQVGVGDTNPAYAPVPPTIGVAAPIAIGGNTACTYGGAPSCWGSGLKGQLGDGVAHTTGTPLGAVLTATHVSVTNPLTGIAVGGSHACAIESVTQFPPGGGAGTSNRVTCWGSNEKGQLGTGGGFVAPNAPTPTVAF